MAENVDNGLMLEILKEIRKDQLEAKKEQRDQRTLLLLVSERVDKLDRHVEARFHGVENRFLGIERKLLNLEERMSSLKDDLYLMVKSELMGALTNFQNKIEIYVDQRLAERSE